MSINGMTNAAAARRVDIGVPDAVPEGFDGIARAAGTVPAPATARAQAPRVVVSGNIDRPGAPDGSVSTVVASASTPVGTTLNVLFGYIPTEVVTLYVAVVAALQPPDATQAVDCVSAWVAFVFFLCATPLIVWLVYGAKLLAAKKKLPTRPRHWPVWEMSAATLAFAAWAFALPGGPFALQTNWYSSALAGVVVLVTSTLLGLMSPIFQRKLPAD